MQLTIPTTEVTPLDLSTGRTVLQNLGAGTIYFELEANLGDAGEPLTVGNGLELSVDDSYEFPRYPGGRLMLIASGAEADLRYMRVP